jgi:hypothetical protein
LSVVDCLFCFYFVLEKVFYKLYCVAPNVEVSFLFLCRLAAVVVVATTSTLCLLNLTWKQKSKNFKAFSSSFEKPTHPPVGTMVVFVIKKQTEKSHHRALSFLRSFSMQVRRERKVLKAFLKRKKNRERKRNKRANFLEFHK